MNQADRDAAKWMEANARFQQRELYKAKETGDAYHINQYGQVITEQHKAKNEGGKV